MHGEMKGIVRGVLCVGQRQMSVRKKIKTVERVGRRKRSA